MVHACNDWIGGFVLVLFWLIGCWEMGCNYGCILHQPRNLDCSQMGSSLADTSHPMSVLSTTRLGENSGGAAGGLGGTEGLPGSYYGYLISLTRAE